MLSEEWRLGVLGPLLLLQRYMWWWHQNKIPLLQQPIQIMWRLNMSRRQNRNLRLQHQLLPQELQPLLQ